MLKILWLAPSFNHYKARFLNHLAQEPNIKLTILSGTGRQGMGDLELEDNWYFDLKKLSVDKSAFGNSKQVRNVLKSTFKDFDWVLIPAEKKNLLLFVYLLWLRKKHKNTKLFSYNHSMLKSTGGNMSKVDLWLTKFYYRNLDRVIFYTEAGCEFAIKNKLIKKHKAFWANNTIDTIEVEKYYQFELPQQSSIVILYIGRLIKSKRVEDLISYYRAIKTRAIGVNLKLEIIGDGPDSNIVTNAIKFDSSIKWHGSIVDEEKIAPIMKQSSIVFIPGLSGLSINHAFIYGRPFVTLEAKKHGPEISYLQHNHNGLLLHGTFEQNVNEISDLILDKKKLQQFCEDANITGKKLSIQKWVLQIMSSLLHE